MFLRRQNERGRCSSQICPWAQKSIIYWWNAANEEITSENPSSLNGKKVGVNKDSIQLDMFRKWMGINNAHPGIVELTSTERETAQMLSSGELDAVVSVTAFDSFFADAKPITMIGSSDYYFAINKHREDIKIAIDQSMSSIYSMNRYYNRYLDEKYMGASGVSEFFTSKEMRWINQHSPIKVGYVEGNLPYCTTGEEPGQVIGLLGDFIENSVDSMRNASVSFEPIAYTDSSEAVTALQNGDIDCVFPLSLTAAQLERQGLLSTEQILETETYVVIRNDQVKEFDLNEVHRVAVDPDNIDFYSITEALYPGWEKVSYNSIDQCAQGVINGSADCMLMNNYHSYLFKDYLDANNLTTLPTGQNTSIAFAVRRDDINLFSILGKLSNRMDNAEVTSILTKYSFQNHKVTIRDFIRENIRLVTGLLMLIVIVFAVMLVRIFISSQKTIELNEQLVKANEAKTTFLSNMSHDIRTPMNAIIGFTNMALTHREDQGLVSESLRKISVSSEHLLDIINDILDMTRVESGKTTLHEEPCSISAMAENVKSIFQATAEAKEISFTVDMNRVEHDVILADRKMLDRILMNILSNAMKFTGEGGSVAMEIEERFEVKNLVNSDNLDEGTGDVLLKGPKEVLIDSRESVGYRFIIKDTGIGMSEEFLQKIFDPFERERTSTVSKQQGTGLGMAIVKKLVDLMNGKIQINSKVGVGSTFIIDLPLRYADISVEEVVEAKDKETEEISLLGKEILLVDDVEINREIAKMILSDHGCLVDEAANGQEAVDMFAKAPNKYDAILMDIQMPVLDGYEATRLIRKLDCERADTIPIIAMTANAFAEDRINAIEAGMNDHVAKPIDIKQLCRTLDKYMSKS